MNKKFTKNQQIMILLVCYLIIPLSGMTTDLYAPALTFMAKYFQVGDAWVRLTMSAFMLGFAVGQIPGGIISDYLGRKTVLIPYFILYIVSSLLAAYTNNLHLLILYRLLQGLACSGPSAIVKSILTDTFSGLDLKKVFSYLSLFWGMGPILAPFFGGYIAHHFGWRAEFFTLSFVGTFYLFLVCLFLKETLSQRAVFRLKSVVHAVVEVVRSVPFIVCSCLMGLTYAYILIFQIIAPFLIQNQLGYSAIYYGYVSLGLGVAWVAGSFLNRMLVQRFLVQHILIGTVLVMVCINGVTYVVMTIYPMSVATLFVPSFLLVLFGGIIFPNCMAYGMSLFQSKAGTASAVLGLIAFSVTALTTAVASFSHTHSQFGITHYYTGVTVVVVICVAIIVKQLSGRSISIK